MCVCGAIEGQPSDMAHFLCVRVSFCLLRRVRVLERSCDYIDLSGIEGEQHRRTIFVHVWVGVCGWVRGYTIEHDRPATTTSLATTTPVALMNSNRPCLSLSSPGHAMLLSFFAVRVCCVGLVGLGSVFGGGGEALPTCTYVRDLQTWTCVEVADMHSHWRRTTGMDYAGVWLSELRLIFDRAPARRPGYLISVCVGKTDR